MGRKRRLRYIQRRKPSLPARGDAGSTWTIPCVHEAHVRVAEIVSEDQQDVGLLLGGEDVEQVSSARMKHRILFGMNGTSDAWRIQRIGQDRIVDRLLPAVSLDCKLFTHLLG